MSLRTSKILISCLSLMLFACNSKESAESIEKTSEIEGKMAPLEKLAEKDKVLHLNFPNKNKELRFIISDDREL